MYKAITASLVNASRVTELLIKRYGPEKISQVERRNECTFLVRLRDGSLAQAVVGANGELNIHELEEVC